MRFLLLTSALSTGTWSNCKTVVKVIPPHKRLMVRVAHDTGATDGCSRHAAREDLQARTVMGLCVFLGPSAQPQCRPALCTAFCQHVKHYLSKLFISTL